MKKKEYKLELINNLTWFYRNAIYKAGVYTKNKFNIRDYESEYIILDYLQTTLPKYSIDPYDMYFYFDFVVNCGKEFYLKFIDRLTEKSYIYTAQVLFGNVQEPLINIFAHLEEYNMSEKKYINEEYEEFLKGIIN